MAHGIVPDGGGGNTPLPTWSSDPPRNRELQQDGRLRFLDLVRPNAGVWLSWKPESHGVEVRLHDRRRFFAATAIVPSFALMAGSMVIFFFHLYGDSWRNLCQALVNLMTATGSFFIFMMMIYYEDEAYRIHTRMLCYQYIIFMLAAKLLCRTFQWTGEALAPPVFLTLLVDDLCLLCLIVGFQYVTLASVSEVVFLLFALLEAYDAIIYAAQGAVSSVRGLDEAFLHRGAFGEFLADCTVNVDIAKVAAHVFVIAASLFYSWRQHYRASDDEGEEAVKMK